MSDKTNIELIIQNISQTYYPLSADCQKELSELAVIKTYDKPTIIVKEGQYADKTYFFAKGCARAFYLKDGKDITDWFAFEGDFINSIVSFFNNVPSPHYIEVLEPSVLLEFSRDNVFNLTEKYLDFERLSRVAITKTMLQLQQRVVDIQFETAQQRYDSLIKIRPDMTLRVPLTHIASYLGITLETLSRIRNPKNRI
jgi:CRP-like cAMP-binding protein